MENPYCSCHLIRRQLQAAGVAVRPKGVVVPDTQALLQAGRLERRDHVTPAALPRARGYAVVVAGAIRQRGVARPCHEPA